MLQDVCSSMAYNHEKTENSSNVHKIQIDSINYSTLMQSDITQSLKRMKSLYICWNRKYYNNILIYSLK